MLNVLIVDDSLVVIKVLKEHFHSLGHNVMAVATNGVEAVELMKTIKPDLITMDIVMKKMDGLEALEIIHKINKDIPIIMITSVGLETTILESLQKGAKGYILKPITLRALSDEIGNNFPKYKTSKI